MEIGTRGHDENIEMSTTHGIRGSRSAPPIIPGCNALDGSAFSAEGQFVRDSSDVSFRTADLKAPTVS